MIWIILELARNLLKACKQDGWHRLTNLVRMSRFHVVYYCLKAAQVIHWFPLVSHVFPVCGHELEVEGQAGSKRSFRIPAPRILLSSRPSFHLAHASKHLVASEQAALAISCTQKLNLKRILQKR